MALPLPHLEAAVSGIFTRATHPCDLGPSEVPRSTLERERVLDGQPVVVGALGLNGSMETHRSPFRAGLYGITKEISGERAVLAHCAADLHLLSDAYDVSMGKKQGGGPAYQQQLGPLAQPLLDSFVGGAFGENLFLDGGTDFHAGKICVGDEFGIRRGGVEGNLRLQVTSPRRPCARVDMRHGKTYTWKGVRAYSAAKALVGFFMRVLAPGDVQDGDVLYLAARPNPDWTLARVASLCYSHPTALMKYAQRRPPCPDLLREEWMGTQYELKELASLPELAIHEWKENLVQLLGLPPIGRFRQQQCRGVMPVAVVVPVFVVLAAAGAWFFITRARGKGSHG